jgi:hypothetical protein
LALAVALMGLNGAAAGRAQESPSQILPDPRYALPADGEAVPQVGSAALIENAKVWDGRTIEFRGEAIGEAMRRAGMAWVHLNDDAYMWKNIEEGAALGGYNSGQAVWLPAELASKIRFYGDYKHDGDVVAVRGRFNAACREHGGDMDIHATELAIVTIGHDVPHQVNAGRLLTGLVLFAMAAVLAVLRRTARSRKN